MEQDDVDYKEAIRRASAELTAHYQEVFQRQEPPMTATFVTPTSAPLKTGDMYALAAANDILIKSLKSNGRTWDCTLHDVLHPLRGFRTVWSSDRDSVLWIIQRYAETRHEYTPPEPEAVAHEPEYITIQAKPIVIELPAENIDQDAIDNAYNEGLQAGMDLVAQGVTPAAPAGAISLDEHRERLVQVQRETLLANAAELATAHQNGYGDGYAEGHSDSDNENKATIDGYENVIKAVRANLFETMATKAVIINRLAEKVREMKTITSGCDAIPTDELTAETNNYTCWLDDQLKTHGVK